MDFKNLKKKICEPKSLETIAKCLWFSKTKPYGFLFLVISISGSVSSGLKHIKSLADIRLLNWISMSEWMPHSCSPAKHVRGVGQEKEMTLYFVWRMKRRVQNPWFYIIFWAKKTTQYRVDNCENQKNCLLCTLFFQSWHQLEPSKLYEILIEIVFLLTPVILYCGSAFV